jgi:transposase
VVTDGSSLYPGVLTQIWPNVAHQLCLFHETRRVTRAAMKAINAIRKNLHHPPPAAWTEGRGPLRDHPPRDDLTDPATQRWYWRQMQRHIEIAYVHQLAQQGLSQRAIARQAGHHRRTIRDWLSQPVPVLPEGMPAEWSEYASLPEALQRKQKKRQLRRQVYELASPVGAELQVVHSFLEGWYNLWTDEGGQRRSLTDAQARFEAWRTKPAYQAVPPLKRVQEQMTNVKFEHLSQFLRDPDWEATNNGAERAGRAFRHRQASYFNLRKPEFIEQAITVAAFQRKEAAMQPPPQPFHTCQRGRKPRQEPDTAASILFGDVYAQTRELPRCAMAP